jgi:hypothetical protein
MKPHEARKMIVRALNHRGIYTWDSISARTRRNPFGGEDLIFVTIKAWEPNPIASELKRIASEHGFSLVFEGPNIVQS